MGHNVRESIGGNGKSSGKFEQFITLPATVSATDFPDNKLGQYKVKLQERLRLTGKRYQVTLLKFLYSNTWYTVTIGRLEVRSNDTGRIIPIDLYRGKHRTLGELWVRMQEATMHMEKLFMFHHSAYHNHMSLICNGSNFSLCMTGDVANIFKFKGDYWYETGTHKAFGGADLDVSCRMMYIYLDLVVDMPVGNVNAPLLRIMLAKGARNADVGVEFSQPQYISAGQVDPDVVSITVATETVEVVPFTSARVALTLHMREV